MQKLHKETKYGLICVLSIHCKSMSSVTSFRSAQFCTQPWWSYMCLYLLPPELLVLLNSNSHRFIWQKYISAHKEYIERNFLLQIMVCRLVGTNGGMFLIWPLGINFSEILHKIHISSFKKMHLKISSAKCRSFCLGLNVLIVIIYNRYSSHWSETLPRRKNIVIEGRPQR